MQFGEKPICHARESHYDTLGEDLWRPGHRDSDGRLFSFWRTCSYCDSMHPEDMIKLFAENKVASLSGSDWKYRYPHKFYIEVDNPEADREVITGVQTHGGKVLKTFYVSIPTLSGKFYNDHLADEMDEEARDAVCKLIEERFQILFKVTSKMGAIDIKYAAPSVGFQASWRRDQKGLS